MTHYILSRRRTANISKADKKEAGHSQKIGDRLLGDRIQNEFGLLNCIRPLRERRDFIRKLKLADCSRRNSFAGRLTASIGFFVVFYLRSISHEFDILCKVHGTEFLIDTYDHIQLSYLI